MKAKINSQLFPIISVAMYGTFLDPNEMFDNYQIDSDFENGDSDFNADEFWEKFDNTKYTKAIEKLASNFLDGEITSEKFDLKIKVKCGELYSPKWYNFANDEIDLTVDYNEEKILHLAYKNRNELDAFLRENYSSHDGFISHTPNNFYDWKDAFVDGHAQSIGAILTFLFSEEIKENHGAFLQHCMENLYYSEFYND